LGDFVPRVLDLGDLGLPGLGKYEIRSFHLPDLSIAQVLRDYYHIFLSFIDDSDEAETLSTLQDKLQRHWLAYGHSDAKAREDAKAKELLSTSFASSALVASASAERVLFGVRFELSQSPTNESAQGRLVTFLPWPIFFAVEASARQKPAAPIALACEHVPIRTRTPPLALRDRSCPGGHRCRGYAECPSKSGTE
jgi:hypothetical protein